MENWTELDGIFSKAATLTLFIVTSNTVDVVGIVVDSGCCINSGSSLSSVSSNKCSTTSSCLLLLFSWIGLVLVLVLVKSIV